MEPMDITQNREQLAQLDKRLAENPKSLHFNRVPPRIKQEFVAWANKEFSGIDGRGDFGMAFKALWDGRFDMEIVGSHINELAARISKLEEGPVKEAPISGIKTVGGKTIGTRR